MLSKFIAQIQTINVTEQSVMLSSYASVEILPARRKLHTAVTVGVSPVTNSRLAFSSFILFYHDHINPSLSDATYQTNLPY